MLSETKLNNIQKFSLQIQIETMKTISKLGTGHIGGSLSIADTLAVLYGKQLKHDPKNPKWRDRDWLVCSKGHAGPAIYSALALRGFMPMKELNTLNRPNTNLPSHCDRLRTPGIDMTTGSLGQGASTAAGVAIGFKMNKRDNNVFLILGDGEIQEGQVWEMAMFASQFKLDNLIGFVDSNKLQLDGPVGEIMNLGNIAAKFEQFGWYAQNIDGHDLNAIDNAIINAKLEEGKPSMIVLNTIKAHGWKEMEGKTSSHCCNISKKQCEEAVSEMKEAMLNI
ncbi:transketolase [Clostridium sp. LBM24168]